MLSLWIAEQYLVQLRCGRTCSTPIWFYVSSAACWFLCLCCESEPTTRT